MRVLLRGCGTVGNYAPGRSVAEKFESWRPRVALWLLLATAIGCFYWIAWFTDRSLVASSDSREYVAFEGAFPIADLWLTAVSLLASAALWRRRPSAILWLAAAGGAGLYLCALDVLYDLQHAVYSSGHGGSVELGINLLSGLSSAGVLVFAWEFRHQLLAGLEPSAGAAE